MALHRSRSGVGGIGGVAVRDEEDSCERVAMTG